MFLAAAPALLLAGRSRAATGIDAALRTELEKTYLGFLEAMRRGDMAAFSRHTSRYRQMCLRNEVVSLGQPWPRAVFKGIMQVPSLAGLTCIDATASGATARLVCFGRVDFALGDAVTPENPVVIRFLREEDGWKFDWLQYVNLGTDEPARQKVRSGSREWLDTPQFALTGTYPAIPKPCRAPYQVAGLSILASGCRVTVDINSGMHVETVDNDAGGRVITGGLQKGSNPVVLTPQLLPGVKDASLTVAVMTRSGSTSRVLWKWSPPDPPDRWLPRYTAGIFVKSAAAVR